MNAKSMARKFRELQRESMRSLEKAAQKAARESKEEAVRWSVGTFKARGEYARRNPRPPYDPAIINIGKNPPTQAFRNNWYVVRVSDGVWRLTNRVPHADYMLGTKLMIRRPIEVRVQTKMKPVFYKYAQKYLQNTFDK